MNQEELYLYEKEEVTKQYQEIKINLAIIHSKEH